MKNETRSGSGHKGGAGQATSHGYALDMRMHTEEKRTIASTGGEGCGGKGGGGGAVGWFGIRRPKREGRS